MAPTYKLTYFDVKALGEPIRMMFAYAKVDYEDIRIDYAKDWPGTLKSQMPWEILPVLEEDGKQLSQSTTIVRYLGRKFGLAGANEWETAKCNEYIDAVVDARLECMKTLKEEDETKKAAIKKTVQQETLPKLFQKLEDILKKNGTGFLVGNGMTYADIYIVHFMEFLSTHLEATDKLQVHQQLMTLIAKVNNSPGIAEWIAKRPVTAF